MSIVVWYVFADAMVCYLIAHAVDLLLEHRTFPISLRGDKSSPNLGWQ